MAGIDADQWLLVLDRTNWKFGKLDINILVLSICHKGIAIPIMWDMLPKAGTSNNVERQQLMERFMSVLGIEKMSALLGDQEFIGDLWLKFLADKMIPFYIRIKANLTIARAEDELVTANHLINNINEDNSTGILYLVSNDLNHDADHLYEIYQKRWQIEVYHKSIKQNASLAKSPTKKVISQSNHIFASIIAFCKLEILQLKTCMNHFALKYKLILRANQAAMLELQNLRKLLPNA